MDIIMQFAVPWLLAHPAVLGGLLYGYVAWVILNETWMRIPETWRLQLKLKHPRWAGFFDASVGYGPSLKKGNSSLVHGVFQGKIKAGRMTMDQQQALIEAGAAIARQSMPAGTPPNSGAR